MSASRPGNPDRGWNDPPMFLYKAENQAQQSPKKTNLTQRVGMPQNYPSLANKTTGSPGKSSPPLLLTPAHKNLPSGPPSTGPPPAGPPPSGPPPSGSPPGSIPPPSRLSGPPPTSATPAKTSPARSDSKDDDLPVDVCETTLAKLKEVLQSCQDKLQKRITDDIQKKLSILEDSWSKDKLSKPVKQRMAKLAEALASQRYDEANELHLSIMFDYVAEVSQWMVGVKRLIFEAKKHVPLKEITDTSDNKDSSDSKQCEEETDSPKSDTQITEDTLVCKTEASEKGSVSDDAGTGQGAEETSKIQSKECIEDSNGTAEERLSNVHL